MDENENFNSSIGSFNYRFANFTVNERNRELFCDGQPVMLTPKAFDILLVFLKNPDRLLEKEELMETVWESKFVEEGNLARNVSTLRKALGGDARDHRYIVTVPGRGYRFVAEIETEILENKSSELNEHDSQKIVGSHSIAGDTRKKRALAIGVLIIVLVPTIFAWFFYRSQKSAGEPEASSIRSIAVLPLKNLSGDPANDYFSEGVTESLVDALSKIDGLKVVSIGSVERLRDGADPAAIAKQLDVAAVLEGNVKKDGDSLWLAVRLISAGDGQILWADDTNERKMTDIFSAQDEIALGVADKLRIQLSPASSAGVSRRSTQNTEAYQLYLKGRYFGNKRTEDGLKKAIENFRQAIDADPNYALAYSGVAESYALLYSYDMLPPSVAVPAAKDAATKAVALDDKLAEPHATLGFVESEHDWNWAEAEREFRTAIALDPNCADCHHWFALHLAYRGHLNESIAEISAAQKLDPLSLIINSNMGRILYFSRQYDEAINRLKSTIEMEPNFWGAHFKLAEVDAALGREQEAVEEYARSYELQNDTEMADLLRKTYAASGYKTAIRTWLDRISERSKLQRVNPYAFAVLYARLGDKEQALNWLERSADEHCSWIVLLKSDPVFDLLKNEPRYAALIRGIDY
jgi:DNA-binding winged helix-turn-helix (wHTH) protein/TolB-like protein/Tfp pilus assembly protein PilF